MECLQAPLRTPSSPDRSRLIPFALDCTRLSPTGACSQAKTLEDEDSEVKNFFEHVIGKTEEILSQNSFARSERHISEVLTHIDLLERTVRLPSQLANIVTDDRN